MSEVDPSGYWRNAQLDPERMHRELLTLRDMRDTASRDLAYMKQRVADLEAEVAAMKDAMIPVRIDCPECGTPHVDKGEWAARPHRTHQCQQCGYEWRPYPVATVGIAPSAEVEGARNAGLEAAADVCARAGAEAHNKYNETIQAGCGVGGEHLYRFDMATALATSIRALKTTPTGGE